MASKILLITGRRLCKAITLDMVLGQKHTINITNKVLT